MIDFSSTELQLFFRFIVFTMGLVVGSFLNVCIYRIPEKKSIVFPPSSCPDCEHNLSPKDMIPVLSYIFLKGKCRYCRNPISVQYSLVEFFTGIIWLLVYLRYGFSIETIALLFLFTLLIPVAIIDIRYMIIPNELVFTGFIGGLILSILHIFIRPFSLYESTLWYSPFLGMISASGIIFIIALIALLIYRNDGGMGMGDVKLFIPIGMFLGWKLALLTLFLSIMIGGIVSIILLVLRIKNRKSAIPFGPFIIIATYITGLYGNDLIKWYINLFPYYI